MMRLAAPWWLGLIVVAIAVGALWLLRRRWQRFPSPLVAGRAAVGASAGGRGPVATAVAGVLAAFALTPLAVSLARPQEVLSRSLERAQGVDMVIALDVSGSMAALDFQPTDRLGVAKEVIARFLGRRPDDRFGLVAFAGAAVTLCPLTLDHDVAQRLLDRVELNMLPDGTAIGMGLGTAVNRLRQSEAESKVVVLVTDGSNNAGQLDPLTAADLAASERITVHTVLVGKGGTVPIPVTQRDPRTGREVRRVERVEVVVNPELLAEISRRTGGTSFRARDPEALEKVFDEIDRMEKTEFTSTRLVRYRERFEPWALAVLAVLLGAVVLEGFAGRTLW
jgi:Ca-activated chloride channel family protein